MMNKLVKMWITVPIAVVRPMKKDDKPRFINESERSASAHTRIEKRRKRINGRATG